MLFYNNVRFYLFFSITKINGRTIGIVSGNKINTGISNNVIGLDTTDVPVPNLGGSGIINILTLNLKGLLRILKINKFINRQ